MSVTASDIHYFKSATGDTAGGALSGVEILGSTLNNFWIDVSDAERTAGGNRTRKWFLTNSHSTDSMLVPSVWVSQTPTGTTERLGVGFNDTNDSDATQGNMTAWGSNAKVALISDGADTRTATIVGLNTSAVPTSEDVTLTGAVEVLSGTTYSVVYAVHLSAVSMSRSVLVKQGTGGTTRGTIGTGKVTCWLWVTATNKAGGIRREDLVAGSDFGYWDDISWSAAVASARPTTSQISAEEVS